MIHCESPGLLRVRRAGTIVLAVLIAQSAFLTAGRADGLPRPLVHRLPTLPAISSVRILTLAECQQLALHGHPKVAAQRASLAAAEDGSRALDALRIPTLLANELPIRRQQAALGVTAAAAALDQAEREVVYAVTRTYFTVLFAREQERVAQSVVGSLSATFDAAEKKLKAEDRDITSVDVNRTKIYLRLAETRRTQATQGEKRARAALREALGQGPDFLFGVPGDRLPESTLRPGKEEVVPLALAHRGELIQARVFLDVVCLEIDAQRTSHLFKMETFAAGSDIHARSVPPEVRNGEYRPGGIPPEMPTVLAGSRSERIQRAASFKARAESVVEGTTNLIALDAEDAFLRWEETSAALPPAREAAVAGDTLAGDLRKDLSTGQKVKVEDVVNANVLAAQARIQYNELLYRQLLALADLERATAGGFCAHLAELPAPRQQPAPKDR